MLGAGVIGLTTASVLLDRGFDVTVRAAESWPRACSAAAGGVWFPILAGDPSLTPPGYADRMERWTSSSWRRYEPKVGASWGVRWITNHELFASPTEPEDYLRKLLPDFEATGDENLPAGFTHRWSFRTFLIESPVFLRRLLAALRSEGVRSVVQRFGDVEQIESIDADVVVNCTGLGSRSLFGDRALRGIRGFQVLHAPVRLPYVIVADEFSAMPRRDALALGSLFLDDPEGTNEVALRERALDRIWKTVGSWTARPGGIGIPPGTLDAASVRRVVTGVRPYRDGGVRLEAEDLAATTIVHNYGHGGSGYTIAWGCADECADICAEVVSLRSRRRTQPRRSA